MIKIFMFNQVQKFSFLLVILIISYFTKTFKLKMVVGMILFDVNVINICSSL